MWSHDGFVFDISLPGKSKGVPVYFSSKRVIGHSSVNEAKDVERVAKRRGLDMIQWDESWKGLQG